MARKQCMQRLKRELQLFQKDPPPFIPEVHVNESDMLEWHFLIQGPPDSPYEGGWYIGKIKFPSDYPFKPPSLMMVTPTGRFQPSTRLCLSMSDFHPETWNAMWSVSTVCVGLLSFMLESTATTGAIVTTDQDKRRLARESLAWNVAKPQLVAMFPSLRDKLQQRQQVQEQGAGTKSDPGISPISDATSSKGAVTAGSSSMPAPHAAPPGPLASAIDATHVWQRASAPGVDVTDESSVLGVLAAAHSASKSGDERQWQAALRVCQQACGSLAPSPVLAASLCACYLRVGAVHQAAAVLAHAGLGTAAGEAAQGEASARVGSDSGERDDGGRTGDVVATGGSSGEGELGSALAGLAAGGGVAEVAAVLRALRASVTEADQRVSRGRELLGRGDGRVPGPLPDLAAAEFGAVLARLCTASVSLRLMQVAAQVRQGNVDAAVQTCIEASSLAGCDNPTQDDAPAFGPGPAGATPTTRWDLEGKARAEDMARSVRDLAARVAECGRQKRLGNEMYRKEAWRDALKHYQRALQLEPTCSSLHFNRAAALSQLARNEDALAACNEALSHHAGYTKARRKRADLLSLLGKHGDAAVEYEYLVDLGGFESHDARLELEKRAVEEKVKARTFSR